VTDPAVQRRVVEEIRSEAVRLGLDSIGEAASPILGSRGNREFLLGFAKR